MSASNAVGPRLTLIVLKTHRLADLRHFYECLGLRFMEERHGSGPEHLSASAGEMLLELYPLPAGTGEADSTTRLGFTVGNMTEVVETLRRHGSPVIAEPRPGEWGFRAVVRDPDGRSVELYQTSS